MRMTARTAWEEMLFPEDLRVERWEKQRVACLIAKNIMENEISARQKQILVLYYKEKKTMPEIARQLGVCISTVSRTHRGAQPAAVVWTFGMRFSSKIGESHDHEYTSL